MAKRKGKTYVAGPTHTLTKVKRFFPNVTLVRDAKDPIDIEVTKSDSNAKAVKDHTACAMAVACKRKLHLDGVIISRSTAYLIKDRMATRYAVPDAVTREIVSFDRGASFEPGDYYLLPPKESQLLGARARRETGDRDHHEGSGNGKKRHAPHVTLGIRAALGGVGSKRNGHK